MCIRDRLDFGKYLYFGIDIILLWTKSFSRKSLNIAVEYSSPQKILEQPNRYFASTLFAYSRRPFHSNAKIIGLVFSLSVHALPSSIFIPSSSNNLDKSNSDDE